MSLSLIRPANVIHDEAIKLGYEGKALLKYVETQQAREYEAEEKRLDREAEERRITLEMEEKRLIREFELAKMQLNPVGSAQHQTFYTRLDKNLKSMSENDDLSSYIELFEITAQSCKIPKVEWAHQLTLKLSGKFQTFMLQTKYINNTDYDFVKAELLRQAHYTEETCRVRWHELSPKSDDLREFYVSLKRSFDDWLKMSKTPATVAGITDLLMRDRIYESISETALRDVVLRKPQSAEQALEFLDQFRDASKGSITLTKQNSNIDNAFFSSAAANPSNRRRTSSEDRGACFFCGNRGHFARWCPQRSRGEGGTNSKWTNPSNTEREDCFVCGSRGHFARWCPQRSRGERVARNDRDNLSNVEREDCFLCGSRYHLARWCPQRDREENTANNTEGDSNTEQDLPQHVTSRGNNRKRSQFPNYGRKR